MARSTGAQTIEDSLNNREWLGWEVTKGWTYAQLNAATMEGGSFTGFTVARNEDAQRFVNAMLGTHSCNSSNSALCKSNSYSLAREELVGESFADFRATGSTFDQDNVFFLSDNSVGSEVGLLEVYNDDALLTGHVAKGNEAMSMADADLNSTHPTRSIGWLMYRNVSPVPEPETYAFMLAGLGLVGLAARRRKRA